MRKWYSWGIGAALLLTTAGAFAQKMGDIAIYTDHVGWIGQGTAIANANDVIKNQKLTANCAIVGAKDIADWTKKKIGDGKVDIILTFGGFPGSLYKAGNGEPENSLGEKFLDDGNFFLNTADYIFYYSDGANNGEQGLKNMTDSNFDMWTDGNTNKPNATGAKLTPSLNKSFVAPRSFKKNQIEGDKNWEIEVIFADNGADYLDPVVIKNKQTGGRVGIAIQVSNDGEPRGPVLTEMLNNWAKTVLAAKAVNPRGKASVAWSEMKRATGF